MEQYLSTMEVNRQRLGHHTSFSPNLPRHNYGLRHGGGGDLGRDPFRPDPTSQLKITYQNIRGWSTNDKLHRRSLTIGDPDVILIADTGMKDDERIGIQPYIPYQRNTEHRSSGAAILIKRNIKHQQIKHQFVHDTVAIQVETTTGPVIIATNYHPPRRQFLPMEDLNWLACHNTPVYLLADLNAHHRTFPHCAGRGNGTGLVLFEWWIKCGRLIRQGPNFPTLFHASSVGTTPDIVLTNNKTYHNHHISAMAATVSDHIPIRMVVSSRPIVKKVHCEDPKRADWAQFTAQIKDASSTLNLRGANSSDIDNEIVNVIDRICDARKTSIPAVKICTRPFITTSPKFNRLAKVLDLLSNIYGSTMDAAIRLHVRSQRHQIVLLLREEGRICAQMHWESMVEKIMLLRATEPRKYWRHVQRLRGGGRGGVQITDDSTPSGTKLTTDAEKEAGMRNVWKDKMVPPPPDKIHPDSIKQMDNHFGNEPEVCTPYGTADFTKLDPTNPYSAPITPMEIYNTINSFALKAPGEDGISKLHLTYLPKITIVNLAHIFSAAYSMGYYPSNLKSAIMVFIPKPNKHRSNPSNYRPISLLSTIGKIYGKILTQRLTMYLADEKLNHPHQYGFVENRGTLSSLAMVYEFISRHKCWTYDSRVCLVLRDIKGAFDRLDHRRVKYHLSTIGVPPVLCKALSSFLDGRTARIRVGDVIGPTFPLEAGSPQGASPSARIYTLVTRKAPIPETIFQYYTSYADDCCQIIATKGKSMQVHGIEVRRAIQTQNDFELREGLISEPTKSYLLPVGDDTWPGVIVDGHHWEAPEGNINLLGLSINRRGLINAQVAKQVLKARRSLASLYRFRSMRTKFKLHLVKALVLPHLFYPAVPLHLASRNQMRKLQRVQNQALRFAFGIKWQSFTTNKAIHQMKPCHRPVNQELYWRAKRIWTNIESGDAGDADQLKSMLQELKIDWSDSAAKRREKFPSSWLAAMLKQEPAPRYG